MFRRSGYRFADKNMRQSITSRAWPDSEGTGHALVSRFRSSPEFTARSQCPDSEVRLNLQLAPVRTSESKDTGQTYDCSAALNPKFAIELRHGCANFGFAA